MTIIGTNPPSSARAILLFPCLPCLLSAHALSITSVIPPPSQLPLTSNLLCPSNVTTWKE
ncbi:hypothetical protein BU24DRAFT_424773 [Aaosphaeria arxii CBS 175.79]|uniref:Uncharacterized protein n=1 Tax=Aaosphaeria arxii CBS 175.79 TaxID=1450172 RepID=A0A6A5XN38_9PLEO|nr:uncharacterized protein BU24DRAFT_424773 [Aaosphaeria arxii CBS 175.79]KAF2013764.1 hypothetical protein BU24DRAFT_424773 [Aaosphaeria arxii CBS 175.79]